jgi:hypothetical protein
MFKYLSTRKNMSTHQFKSTKLPLISAFELLGIFGGYVGGVGG